MPSMSDPARPSPDSSDRAAAAHRSDVHMSVPALRYPATFVRSTIFFRSSGGQNSWSARLSTLHRGTAPATPAIRTPRNTDLAIEDPRAIGSGVLLQLLQHDALERREVLVHLDRFFRVDVDAEFLLEAGDEDEMLHGIPSREIGWLRGLADLRRGDLKHGREQF